MPIPKVIMSALTRLNEGHHHVPSKKAKGKVNGKARSVPSHDFLGLTFCASMCLPSLEPVRYANVSKSQVINKGMRAMVKPIFLRGMIVAGSKEMKIIPNTVADNSARKLGSRREPGNRMTDSRQTKKKRM